MHAVGLIERYGKHNARNVSRNCGPVGGERSLSRAKDNRPLLDKTGIGHLSDAVVRMIAIICASSTTTARPWHTDLVVWPTSLLFF